MLESAIFGVDMCLSCRVKEGHDPGRDACPSGDEGVIVWVAELPAGVVQEERCNHGSALEIESAEVGESLDVGALQELTAILSVVEARERGEEHFLARAHDADGAVDEVHLRAEVPLALGVIEIGVGAPHAKELRSGEAHAALPGFEKTR